MVLELRLLLSVIIITIRIICTIIIVDTVAVGRLLSLLPLKVGRGILM